jgi:hypothetical protein
VIGGAGVNIFAKFHSEFMIGYIEEHARFMFGWLYADSGLIKGIIISKNVYKSGLFIAQRNIGSSTDPEQICLYLRDDTGEFSEKCLLDPSNKFQLYYQEKTFQQTQLNE